jgi:adenosine deaminase
VRVTVNTDNRLITDTTVSKELFLVHTRLGVPWPAIKQIILNGFKSAFLPFHERRAMLRTVAMELDQFERDYRPSHDAPLTLHTPDTEAVNASSAPEALSS